MKWFKAENWKGHQKTDEIIFLKNDTGGSHTMYNGFIPFSTFLTDYSYDRPLCNGNTLFLP